MRLRVKAAKHLIVISGPLASGKTTFKKSLCTKLGQRIIPEFEEGIDLAAPNWKALEAYASEEGSSIVECHFSYKGRDPGDPGATLGPISAIPRNIKVIMILPSFDTLYQRQNLRYPGVRKNLIQEDLDWYSTIAQALKAEIIS